MPSEDGRRLDDNEAGSPVAPGSGEGDPQQAIQAGKVGPVLRPVEDAELMVEGDVLKGDSGGTGEERAQEGPQAEHQDHREGLRHRGVDAGRKV